jgi:hypothetical protein
MHIGACIGVLWCVMCALVRALVWCFPCLLAGVYVGGWVCSCTGCYLVCMYVRMCMDVCAHAPGANLCVSMCVSICVCVRLCTGC